MPAGQLEGTLRVMVEAHVIPQSTMDHLMEAHRADVARSVDDARKDVMVAAIDGLQGIFEEMEGE